MEIALIIAGGLVLATFFATFFDFLTKRKKKGDQALENKVGGLEKRIESLEMKLLDKDEKISRLENDISFVNRLLEDKSKKR